MKATIYRDRKGEWRWRMRAANNRVVADSGEGYTRRSSALRAFRMFVRGVFDGIATDACGFVR